MKQVYLSVLLVLVAGCNFNNANRGIADLDIDAYRLISAEENLALLQAPMLKAKVDRGELPRLNERLPADPLIVPVAHKIGLYGGTWRKFDLAADYPTMRLLNHYYGLTRWSPDAQTILPGLASRYDVSPDGQTITFDLRRGVRWSDGAPFTADDILFWWNLALDERYLVAPPEWAYTAGERMEVTAPDPYTIRFSYRHPFYFLPLIMATGFWTAEEIIMPSHYLRQFHPDFNPEYTDFNELDRRRNVFNNPDRPTLAPWRLTYYSPTGDQLVLERNPYYWAVDSLGRQLPYIDRIETIRVQNAEAGVLSVIAGDIDMQFRDVNLSDLALLRHFEDQGDYRLLTWEEGTATWHTIFLNLENPDRTRRSLFQNPEFRRALAIGIDRERMLQVIWHGHGRAQSAAISDESWHFTSEHGQSVFDEWTTRWSEYDPNQANALLDAAGLAERDDAGFRMYQGEPLRLQLNYREMPYAADQAELIKDDWERLGIRVLAKRLPPTDFWTRIDTGQYDMYLEKNSELDLFTFPGVVFPVDAKTWHPLTGRWYRSGGVDGEAPSGYTADLLALYEAAKREPDRMQRHELVLNAIQIQLEHGPFMIGTIGRQKAVVVVKNYVRNVPAKGPVMAPWAQVQPAASFPEQFYYSAEHLYRTE